jgi:hypothetical protein
LISTPEQLNAMRNNSYNFFELTNDIDLTTYLASGDSAAVWSTAGWLPIGGVSTPFYGTINGKNPQASHSI